MPFMTWAMPAETGDVLKMLRTSSIKAPPWVLVPEPLGSVMRQEMGRFKILDGSTIVEKRHARLSVSKPTFLADGNDHADVMVIPDEPYSEPARLKVNGVETFLAPGEILEITSEEEGVFHLHLDDPVLWSTNPRRETLAVQEDE